MGLPICGARFKVSCEPFAAKRRKPGALGRLWPPGSNHSRPIEAGYVAVDLDGDGIADTLNRADRRGLLDRHASGIHTAVARSGRDGHVIWRAVLDPWDRVWESKCRDWYDALALEMPDGDLDGDGTADVFVRKVMWEARSSATRMPKALPVKVLSGAPGRCCGRPGSCRRGSSRNHISGASGHRRGSSSQGARLMFSCGTTQRRPRRCRRQPLRMPGKPSLARISGRDGRVLWEVNLTDQVKDYAYMGIPPLDFADLNGDGAIDGLVRLGSKQIDDETEDQLQAISLRDGKRLWSARLRQGRYRDQEGREGFDAAEVGVGDLDGDGRPEVAVVEFDRSYSPLKAQVARWTDAMGRCGGLGIRRAVHLRTAPSRSCSRTSRGRGRRVFAYA